MISNMFPMPPQFDTFRKKEESTRKKCQWENCEEAHGEIKWAIDQYCSFCSVYCREEYFSSIGGGDSRGCRDPNDMDSQEKKYIRSLPSPA